MSEVKNMYLSFEGLQRYDELIKDFIADKGLIVLRDALDAFDAKLGDFAGSDDKTVAAIIDEIYGSIAELVAKDAELAGKDAELEGKIAEEIAKIVGSLGEGESHLTLAEIAAQLKSLGDRVGANEGEIADIKGRVDSLETAVGDNTSGLIKAVADLRIDVEGMTGDAGSISSQINKAIENLDLPNTYEAKGYADSLATNYDTAGSAATAQAAAEANAKTYADGLVKNAEGKSLFDAAGDAAAAEAAAKSYADKKAGANAELIGGLATRIGTLEGISHAANVVYNDKTKYINIVDKDGNVIGAGFDASPFIVDGMLDGVAFEEVEGVKTNNLVFTFNTAAGKNTIPVDFTKYVDVYQGDGSSIELNSLTKTFSVKEVDASQTKLSKSIEVNGGPLADDSNDNWPWTEGGKKVIPAGKTMEQILTSLFLKVTNGTVTKGSITWKPSLSKPTVSITQSGTVEVGTKLTATANTTNTVSSNSRTCTFTCSPGYFLSTGTDDNGNLVFGSFVDDNITVTANSVDPAYDGTPSIKTYWNNTEVANVNGTTEYTVSIVGDNTFRVDQSGVTAYAGAFDDITVYGSTNTKVPAESVSASISGDVAPDAKPLTSTNSATVKGARAYWMGCMPSPLAEFTNATIREAGEDADSGLKKTLSSSPATTLEVPAGSYDVVIITQKQVTSVISKAQGNFEIGGNFTKNHQEVNVDGANGFTAIKYHVYHCNADWDKDTLTISYK